MNIKINKLKKKDKKRGVLMKMMDDVVNNYFPELEKENMSSLNNKWGL